MIIEENYTVFWGTSKKIIQLLRHGLPRYVARMDEYGCVTFDDNCWLAQRLCCERDTSLYTGTIVGGRSRHPSGGTLDGAGDNNARVGCVIGEEAQHEGSVLAYWPHAA